MVSKFVNCQCCGKLETRRKMRFIDNKWICQNCAKIAETKNKRAARHSDDYQVVVVLLNGKKLCYEPIMEG